MAYEARAEGHIYFYLDRRLLQACAHARRPVGGPARLDSPRARIGWGGSPCRLKLDLPRVDGLLTLRVLGLRFLFSFLPLWCGVAWGPDDTRSGRRQAASPLGAQSYEDTSRGRSAHRVCGSSTRTSLGRLRPYIHPWVPSLLRLCSCRLRLVRIARAGDTLAHLPSLHTFRRPRCLISSPSTTGLRLVC